MQPQSKPRAAPSTPPFMSASAWSTPYVLMSIWGVIQLWLHNSPVQSLSQDLLTILVCSSVIASSILPLINRSVGVWLSSGEQQRILESTLSFLMAALALSAVLSMALLTQNLYFRSPLHWATQLAGTALVANCWIMATVLLSSDERRSLFHTFSVGGCIFALTLSYQPAAGLSYHALSWLSATAIIVVLQARALAQLFPQPTCITLPKLSNLHSSLKLSLASTLLCLALWLSRPSTHSTLAPTEAMQLLESSQSVAYLVLLPVAIAAWRPLEHRFKKALFAFEQAAHGDGDLSTLDYKKNDLEFQSLSGIKRVCIALITAAVVTLAFNQLLGNRLPLLQGPDWMLPLNLVQIGLQVVALCAIRLLFYLRRDRELLTLALVHLTLTLLSTQLSVADNTLPFVYGLVVSSGCTCLLSMWFLRHGLKRLDYLFFMEK